MVLFQDVTLSQFIFRKDNDMNTRKEWSKRNIEELAKAYTIVQAEYEAFEKIYDSLRIALEEYITKIGAREVLQARSKLNDLIVLFCVRARNLINFFREDYHQRKNDDIKLTDFGIPYSIFNDFDPIDIENIVNRVNKEISHLTYESIKDMAERKWNFDSIFFDIRDRVRVFTFEIFHKTEISELSIKQQKIQFSQLFRK